MSNTTIATPSRGITLLGLMRKGSFQLADAVASFLNGDLEITNKDIVEVLRKIPEQEQVFTNVAFLKNLTGNVDLFQKLVDNAFIAKEDESATDSQLKAIKRSITTFKNLEKLKDVITVDDYNLFVNGVSEGKPADSQVDDSEDES